MKKIAGRRLIVFFGILLVTAGMVVGGSLEAAASPPWLTEKDYIEVTMPQNASQAAAQLSEDDMPDIAETLKSPVAWWGNAEGTISTEKRQTRAEVYAVGGPYTDFHPVRMLSGSFLSPLEENGSSIVLDDDLAWQLFGTTDAVGMEVEYEDRIFTVTGICGRDTSLLGLLSDSGMNRAYIKYGALDSIPVAGMEAAVPKSLPGKSLQAVKDALGVQGKPADAFLVRDVTEGVKLDAETAGLPAIVFAAILTGLIIVCVKNAVSGMARGLRGFMEETYFTESWRFLLRRIAYMTLVIAAGAGLVCTFWLLADFPFFLPGRFIPGSWIDAEFYKNLLQSQAREAIAALEYIPQPWKIARDAGMQIAGYMNMLSFAGMAVFGAGLALMRDARETGTEKTKGFKAGIMDIPAVWIFLTASAGIGFLIVSAMGLKTVMPIGRIWMLLGGFTLWSGWSLYKDRIINFINRWGNLTLNQNK